MVSDQTDMLDRDEAAPSHPVDKIRLAREVTETGEATIHLRDGSTEELHDYDTHFYVSKGVLFTVSGDDEELWVFAEDIVKVERH